MAEDSNFTSIDDAGKVAEPSSSAPPNRIVNYVRTIGAFSILLACLGVGGIVATVFWSSTSSRLQTDLHSTQDELVKAKEEIEKTKSDFADYVKSHPSVGEVQVQIRLQPGLTATTGDDLRVTLISTELPPNANRYAVNATVVSPGYPEMTIRRAKVGYMASYPGKTPFDIKIVGADAVSATLLIVRKNN